MQRPFAAACSAATAKPQRHIMGFGPPMFSRRLMSKAISAHCRRTSAVPATLGGAAGLSLYGQQQPFGDMTTARINGPIGCSEAGISV
jgi:hypothetical protein